MIADYTHHYSLRVLSAEEAARGICECLDDVLVGMINVDNFGEGVKMIERGWWDIPVSLMAVMFFAFMLNVCSLLLTFFLWLLGRFLC